MTKCASVNINNHLSIKHNGHYQGKGIIIILSTWYKLIIIVKTKNNLINVCSTVNTKYFARNFIKKFTTKTIQPNKL